VSKHRTDLTKGLPLPSTWVNSLMEFVSTLSANLVVSRANNNTVQVVAGTANDQVIVGIMGRWRYNTATVQATHPGGAAGTYDVYVTAADNDFSAADPADSTNYAFGLAVRATGSPPATALYRKVATLDWDGGQITGITPLGVASPSLLNLIDVAATGRLISSGAFNVGRAYDATHGYIGHYIAHGIYFDGTNWVNNFNYGNNGWGVIALSAASGTGGPSVRVFGDVATGGSNRSYTPAQFVAKELFTLNNDGTANLGGQALVKTNDTRLTNARTPTAHASSHYTGGTDELSHAVLASQAVLEPGIVGQIKAGRALVATDFTTLLGLAAPTGLWPLTSTADVSGNARTLSNKGAVPFTGTGILGNNAVPVYVGTGTQVLYIDDTGAADPFRLRAFTFGAWIRTAKKGVYMDVLSKWSDAGGQYGYLLRVTDNGKVQLMSSYDGSNPDSNTGDKVVTDDRWHFVVGVHDGYSHRIYTDGMLDGGGVAGLPFQSNGPFNIGGRGGNAGNNAQEAWYGRIDQAFITPDVLTEDQIRLLMCAKIAHGYPTTPRRAHLNVRRRRKSAGYVSGSFPTAPRRLYALDAASGTDSGAQATNLAASGTPVAVGGADGQRNGATHFNAASYLQGSDTGLPTTGDRSVGCWFRTRQADGYMISYGQGAAENAFNLRLGVTGELVCDSWGTNQVLSGPQYFFGDRQWHFGVITYQGAAADGLRYKLYADGRMIASAVGSAITTVLTGATGLKIGARNDGNIQFPGAIDGAFICDYALSADQIAALYAVGVVPLGPSPKNPGDHVEVMDATNIYALHDTLDSQHLLDLTVTA
jgi:hypothetical protein